MYLNLKMQIWRSGIRQNRLAQILGIDEALLSKIVNGYRLPKPEMRSQIAKVLQHDEAWLFSAAVPEEASSRNNSDEPEPKVEMGGAGE
jgi:transcriptional regulator with XRE-family HTH domain